MTDHDDGTDIEEDGHFAREAADYNYFARQHALYGTPQPKRDPFMRAAMERLKTKAAEIIRGNR